MKRSIKKKNQNTNINNKLTQEPNTKKYRVWIAQGEHVLV